MVPSVQLHQKHQPVKKVQEQGWVCHEILATNNLGQHQSGPLHPPSTTRCVATRSGPDQVNIRQLQGKFDTFSPFLHFQFNHYDISPLRDVNEVRQLLCAGYIIIRALSRHGALQHSLMTFCDRSHVQLIAYSCSRNFYYMHELVYYYLIMC